MARAQLFYFFIFSICNLSAMQQTRMVGISKPRTKPQGLVKLADGTVMQRIIAQKILTKCRSFLDKNYPDSMVARSLFKFYTEEKYNLVEEHAKILLAEGLIATDSQGKLKRIEAVGQFLRVSADFDFNLSNVTKFNDPLTQASEKDLLALKNGKHVDKFKADDILRRCRKIFRENSQAASYLFTLYKYGFRARGRVPKEYMSAFIELKLLDGSGKLIPEVRDIILAGAIIDKWSDLTGFMKVNEIETLYTKEIILKRGGAVLQDEAADILRRCKQLYKCNREAAVALVQASQIRSVEELSQEHKVFLMQYGLLDDQGRLYEPVPTIVRVAALIDEHAGKLRGFDELEEIERINGRERSLEDHILAQKEDRDRIFELADLFHRFGQDGLPSAREQYTQKQEVDILPGVVISSQNRQEPNPERPSCLGILQEEPWGLYDARRVVDDYKR